MMTFTEYTNARCSRKWGIAVDHDEIAEFEAAQHKSCPKCLAYVFDPYGWNWVIHDVTGCSKQRPNVELTGAGKVHRPAPE